MILCGHCESKTQPSKPATHQLLFRSARGTYLVSFPACDDCRTKLRERLANVTIISSLSI